MKAIILVGAVVMALGVGTAFADGSGGTTVGYQQWQAANCNSTIPATQWYALAPDVRLMLVQRSQQEMAASIWPDANERHSNRCAKWLLGYREIIVEPVASASARSAR